MFMFVLSLSLYLLATFFGVCALLRKPFCNVLSGLLMLFAFGSYSIGLFYIYLREKTFPLGDPYGFISFLSNLFVVSFLFLAYRHKNLLGFAYLVAFVGFLATLFALPSSPSPYKSSLYGLHLIFASFSYLFALMGGISSSLRLLLERRLKRHIFFQAHVPLDSLRRAERLSINLAFLGFTFTLIFGSLWARTQFGKHWIDDLKLITTLLLWLYYAVLSHLNLLKKLKPKRFSEAVLLGTFLSLINLFFVRHNL